METNTASPGKVSGFPVALPQLTRILPSLAVVLSILIPAKASALISLKSNLLLSHKTGNSKAVIPVKSSTNISTHTSSPTSLIFLL